MTTLEYTRGVSSTIEGAWLALKQFMTAQAGWELYDTISDTTSDRHYIFKSNGNEVGRFRPIYAKWRAYSSAWIEVDVYTSFFVSTDTGTDSLYVSNTSNGPSNGVIQYHIMGDADGVWFVYYSYTDARWYNFYTGFFDSFFSDEEEQRYPVCTIGQRYYYRWFDESRIRAYVPWALSSGTGADYTVHKDVYTELLANAQPSKRDGSLFNSKLVIKS